MSVTDWQPFLQEYSKALLEDDGIRNQTPSETIESGWMGFGGASELEIQQSEARLGVRLPPSYRAFLGTSNGWRHASYFIYDLLPTSGIRWFHEKNHDWIDAFVEPMRGTPDLSDEDYLVYGDGQDPCQFRVEYLQTALQISERGDSAIYLLNPKILSPEGEWEAWSFANWYPGAYRHKSFRHLMESNYRSMVRQSKLAKIPVNQEVLIQDALPILRELVRVGMFSPTDAAIEYMKTKKGNETFDAWIFRGGIGPVFQALTEAAQKL